MNEAQQQIWSTMDALMSELRAVSGGDASLTLRELLWRCPPQSPAHRLAATSCKCRCGAIGPLPSVIEWEDMGAELAPVCSSCGSGDGLTLIVASEAIN